MRRSSFILVVAVTFIILGHRPLAAEGQFESSCELAVHEERVELEDAQLEVRLAASRLASFEKIYVLIDKLWQGDAIQRMTFLRAKFNRDAARLDLERSELLQQRQQALVDHYKVICGADDEGQSSRNSDESLDDIRARYRRADCAQQVKAQEVAEVDLEFNVEWLASVKDLRANDVATIQDVISAELDVKLEQQRLADAKARAANCRSGD